MEMALQQTKNFGYLPNDLLDFFSGKANYDFYRIDENHTKLIKTEKIEKSDIGANFICFPQKVYDDRFESIKHYLR
jgi:hypothetical protein